MKKDQFIPVPYPNFSISPRPYMNRHSAERQLSALIALGNPKLLAEQLDSWQTNRFTATDLSRVSLTQARYEGNTTLNLALRAAVNHGVPGPAAQSLRDSFGQKLETTQDISQLVEIVHDGLIRFCEAVHIVILDGYCGSVRQCCEYIFDNLHRSLSLDELGQVCHLSPHYVSDIFRKEMGIGALQYVHQVKMQYAKFLLEHSDQGIAEISALLSYPSHSNFSQRFKKVYGITPHEFRLTCGR